jgi:hypothetical protein
MVDVIKKIFVLTTKWMPLLPNLYCCVERKTERRCRANEADYRGNHGGGRRGAAATG